MWGNRFQVDLTTNSNLLSELLSPDQSVRWNGNGTEYYRFRDSIPVFFTLYNTSAAHNNLDYNFPSMSPTDVAKRLKF